jgi:hypothetical protein
MKEPEEILEILRGVTMRQDLANIERAIAEAKGKVVLEPAKGFWEEKTPCWELNHCPETIRDKCPAFTDQNLPCWKVEGTFYKRSFELNGKICIDTSICQVCRVYKKYGAGEPIELEPVGSGIDARVRSVEDLAEKRL